MEQIFPRVMFSRPGIPCQSYRDGSQQTSAKVLSRLFILQLIRSWNRGRCQDWDQITRGFKHFARMLTIRSIIHSQSKLCSAVFLKPSGEQCILQALMVGGTEGVYYLTAQKLRGLNLPGT